jgi:hypothetical protein
MFLSFPARCYEGTESKVSRRVYCNKFMETFY